MSVNFRSFDDLFSVVLVNLNTLERCIDDLREVLDFLDSDSSTQFGIIRTYLILLESQYYTLESYISSLHSSYYQSKGDSYEK